MGLVFSLGQLLLSGTEEDRQIWRVIGLDGRGGFLLAKTAATEATVDEVTTAKVRATHLRLQWKTNFQLQELCAAGLLSTTSLRLRPGGQVQSLTPRAQSDFDRRIRIMSSFLDPQALLLALRTHGDLKTLCSEATRKASQLSTNEKQQPAANYTALVYLLLKLLITFGFEPSSLSPQCGLRGAPGKKRPYGPRHGRNKPGVKKRAALGDELQILKTYCVEPEMASRIAAFYRSKKKPGITDRSIYISMLAFFFGVEAGAANANKRSGANLKNGSNRSTGVTLKAQGQYPNVAQFRYVIRNETTRLERFKRSTTKSHFNKNFRGLPGSARDGVLGAGHKVLIDSTVSDIFLRSVVRPEEFVGRSVGYVIGDQYSTAWTGFYPCLSSPTSESAATAIFISLLEPELQELLYGFPLDLGLDPAPAIPACYFTDRGEYLSADMQNRLGEIGATIQYAPSGRPDLRSLPELGNRYCKDAAFGFVPGAFDARRKEVELKRDAKSGVFNLLEWLQFIIEKMREENLSADRRKHCPAEMLAAGYPATPAGLWKYSHDIGTAYRKETGLGMRVKALLPYERATIDRSGIRIKNLKYSPVAGDLDDESADARRYLQSSKRVFYVPNSLSAIWVEDQAGDEPRTFRMRDSQSIPTTASYFDWLDARKVTLQNHNAHEHQRNEVQVQALINKQALRDAAVSRVDALKEQGIESSLSIATAKTLEATHPLARENEELSQWKQSRNPQVSSPSHEKLESALESIEQDSFSFLNKYRGG